MPWPAAPPCAVTWSTSRPATRPPPANRCCTCRPTGPGRPTGKPCGTTSSATIRRRNRGPPDPHPCPCPPRHPRPDQGTANEEKLAQASRSHTTSPCPPRRRTYPTGPQPPENTDPRIEAKYSAASHFRQIPGKDDRPRAMHTEAERTERHLLPEVLPEVIERHEARRREPHGRST